MVMLRTLIPILAMASMAGCATKPESTQMLAPPVVVAPETDTYEVMKAEKNWRDAFNSRDPIRLAAVYDATAVLWDLDATSVVANIVGTGGAAIARHFADDARRKAAQVKVESGGHIRRSGDVGITTGIYMLTESIDGRDVSRPVRYTLVFRKREGVWLVYAQHSSPLP